MFKKFSIITVLFLLTGVFADNSALAKAKTNEKPLQGAAVVNISSDQVEYFEAEDKVVATGNVIIHTDGQDTTLEADKVTYEKAKDVLIAEKNVKIIKKKQVINGDYARIDLTKDSAIIDNLNTELNQIRVDAKTATIYPKKGDPNKKDIEVFTGKATISDPNMIYMFSRSGSKFINEKNANPEVKNMNFDKNTAVKVKTDFRPSYKMKSKEILVKRSKETDIVTLKNVTIKINRYTVAKFPSLTLSSNKENKQVETNLPEIGRTMNLGYYAGWGPVFNLPRGSTLKVVPVISSGDGVGAGALARYLSSTNKTEMGYTTNKSTFVINGEQTLPFISPTTRIQYANNDYIDNGFFGRQMQRTLVEVVDERKLASACNFDLDLRSSAGFIAENSRWSTGKFQLQGNVYNTVPLYQIGKDLSKNISFGVNGQTSIAVYGNGDSYGVLRAGPTMNVSAGPLYSWIAYYQGGIYGETPISADRFYYGKSNVSWASSYRVNKYLTLGYITSLNLSKDNWDKKLLAENQIYFWTGPDDLRFKVGYDTKRKATTFDFNILVGADKSVIDFNKMKIIEN